MLPKIRKYIFITTESTEFTEKNITVINESNPN